MEFAGEPLPRSPDTKCLSFAHWLQAAREGTGAHVQGIQGIQASSLDVLRLNEEHEQPQHSTDVPRYSGSSRSWPHQPPQGHFDTLPAELQVQVLQDVHISARGTSKAFRAYIDAQAAQRTALCIRGPVPAPSALCAAITL